MREQALTLAIAEGDTRMAALQQQASGGGGGAAEGAGSTEHSGALPESAVPPGGAAAVRGGSARRASEYGSFPEARDEFGRRYKAHMGDALRRRLRPDGSVAPLPPGDAGRDNVSWMVRCF